MEMKDLNKNQIVLLTLLISFVTSIATGIMTVSLLQEAPLEVTRTINRVVEKTIETVAPSVANNSNPDSGSKETTVVVNEEDLVIDSIDKNVKSIARIHETDAAGVTTFYGIGLVISKDGLISADRKAINAGSIYGATMSDGTEMDLTPMGAGKDTNFIVFKASERKAQATSSTTPAKAPYVFSPATFASVVPQLGQTLIGLGGDTKNSIAVGRVISLDTKDSGTGTSTVTNLVDIDTDASGKDLVNGSPAFNLSGDVIGIRLSSDDPGSFTPVSILKKELAGLTEPQTAQ
jgi:S1-C subfamily serine protease